MPVPINPPIIVPLVPERSFDQWFYTSFTVTDITPTSGSLAFAKVPMNSVSGDTLASDAIGVRCNLWEAAANVPEAAAALQAVLNALPAIETWANSQS